MLRRIYRGLIEGFSNTSASDGPAYERVLDDGTATGIEYEDTSDDWLDYEVDPCDPNVIDDDLMEADRYDPEQW